ncbi:hypothetical protein V9L05_11370 [Bernardetia sp. Wsw4-3y2]|uniref:hypothetical protein n=1 Tax=Bernardetia sp. Wsw4-3y2 TaxID=3127471 RepID=UPI0030D24062
MKIKVFILFSFLFLGIGFEGFGYDKILVGEGNFYDSTASVYSFSQNGQNWWDRIGKKNVHQIKVNDTLCSIDKESYLSIWLVNEISPNTSNFIGSTGNEDMLFESKAKCKLIDRIFIKENVKRLFMRLVFKYEKGFEKNISTKKLDILNGFSCLTISNSQKLTEHINLKTNEGYDYNICSDNYYSVIKSIFKIGNRSFAVINEYSNKGCPEFNTIWIIEIIGAEYRRIWHYGTC